MTTTSAPNPAIELQKIENKALLQKLHDYFSVPIHEALEHGQIKYLIGSSSGGGAITSKYMVNIKRNIDRCYRLSNEVQRQFAEANNMGVWSHMYLTPSDTFVPSNNVGRDTLKVSIQKNPAGAAGNTSKTFFSPHIPEICKGELRKLMGKPDNDHKWTYKMLSGFQVDLLRDSSVLLLFTHEERTIGGGAYSLDIGSMTEEDVDRRTLELQEDGFRPVRLLFDSFPKELSLLYNVTSINDELDKLLVGKWNKGKMEKDGSVIKRRSCDFKGAFDRYLDLQTTPDDQVVVLKRGDLIDIYGIDIRDAVVSDISNNNFYLVLNQAGRVRGVHVLQKIKAYFLFPDPINLSHSTFNAGAFTEQKMIFNGNTRIGVSPPNGDPPYSVPFYAVSVEKVLEEDNWEGIADQKKRTISERFDFWHFFAMEVKSRFFRKSLDQMIGVTLSESIGLGDNEIEKELVRCASSSEYFKLVQYKREGNYLVNDRKVVFKPHPEVTFEVYDRYSHTPYSTAGDASASAGRDLSWIYLRKGNTAFEREKSLTLLYLQHRLDHLRRLGHTNIRVVLERPVPKFEKGSGNGTGFIDLGLFSSGPDGKRYGQLYEFKAWGHINDAGLKKIEDQACNYNVEEMVSGWHEQVDFSYDSAGVNQVCGHNLELHTLESLARAPILSDSGKKLKP